MIVATQTQKMTREEYLAFERTSEEKHEYINGEGVLMTGASRKHNIIAGNIYAFLHRQLIETNCEIYQSDMRVKIEMTGRYVYPDVCVVCEEPRLEDANFDTLLNPTVVFEVLSPSTEGYDRGDKFLHYRSITSLTDYVLVAQDRYHMEQFTRQSDHTWLLRDLRMPDAILTIDSIGCQLALVDVYRKVQIDEDDLHLNGHRTEE